MTTNWTDADIETLRRNDPDFAKRNPIEGVCRKCHHQHNSDYIDLLGIICYWCLNNLPCPGPASKIAPQSTREGIKAQGGNIQHKREMTESELRENIRDAAIKLGWEFYFTWSSIHSPRGMTDLILCRPPRLIFAELKRDGMELTKYQAIWCSLLQQCPQVEYCLWHPADWANESIIEKLR